MEAVTDLPFRTVCEELGAALTFTEFLSADALTRGASGVIERMWPSLGGRAFAVQIFGRDPAVVSCAAQMAVDRGAALLDINMGCPSKNVTAGACGSALMREPELAVAIVRATRNALPAHVPVTVKHRAGWDDNHLNAADFACRLVDAGAAMITVHGRTRAQGFSGSVRLEPIAAVRRALPAHIPVVGNGDIATSDDVLAMKQATGCDGVMIGRSTRGNPWIFRTLRALERGEPDPGPPTVAERRHVWRRHAELVVAYSHPRKLIHELRKTLAWYSRGLRGGSDLRQRAGAHPEPEALLALGETFFDGLAHLERVDGGEALQAVPADATQKAIERQERRCAA
jgi:nifR3 family TIM-barrel protein